MSSLPEVRAEAPELPEILRGVARTLDQLGVLLLLQADVAEGDRRPADDPLLTVAEAAAELRCSESLIRAACGRGQIQAMRNGGWKIRRSALQKYERRRIRGGAKA